MFGLERQFSFLMNKGRTLRLQARTRGSMLGVGASVSFRRNGTIDGPKSRLPYRARGIFLMTPWQVLNALIRSPYKEVVLSKCALKWTGLAPMCWSH
jgi:hypothetical protein